MKNWYYAFSKKKKEKTVTMNQEIIFHQEKTGTMLNQEDDFLNQQHDFREKK